MSAAGGIPYGKGVLMRVAKRWRLRLLAAAGAALLAGCQKAGDGLGLDENGKALAFCEANPGDPACVAVDPCVANPAAPGCPADPCKAVPPAPGCSVDVCAADPSRPGCQPKVRFAEVLPVLEANYCLVCHVKGGTGYAMTGLLLSADSAYAHLVDVPSYNQAAAAGFVRVKPGNPDSSILYIKISMSSPKLPNGRPIGSAMPMGRKLMDSASVNLVKRWIQDGALP